MEPAPDPRTSDLNQKGTAGQSDRSKVWTRAALEPLSEGRELGTSGRQDGPKVRVALVELESGVGHLPYLVAMANTAQSYYWFRLEYLPYPSGTFKYASDPSSTEPPRLFLPRIDDFLRPLPAQLDAKLVCVLTSALLGGFLNDGSLFGDYVSAGLPHEPRVSAISTHMIREYAREAGVPFIKAVLFVCIGVLLVSETPLDFHRQTVGCPLDSCEGNRKDLIVGLRHMRFDHQPCRERIVNWDGGAMLRAIDALLALPLSDHATISPPAREQQSLEL